MKKMVLLIVLMAIAVSAAGTCFAFVPSVAGASTPGVERPTNGVLPIIPPPPPPKSLSGDRTMGVLPIIPPPPPPKSLSGDRTMGVLPIIPPPPPPKS